MSEFNEYDLQKIADQIECYLKCRPNAADTLEGIVQWWLPHQSYEQGKAQVQKTLEDLVAQGVVKKDRLSDGTAIYSSADKKKRED